MPLERTDMQLILFDPSRDAEVGAESAGAGSTQRIDLGGEWDFRLEPLLDNRFGDYQWPGTDEKISACIYDAEYERARRRGSERPRTVHLRRAVHASGSGTRLGG